MIRIMSAMLPRRQDVHLANKLQRIWRACSNHETESHVAACMPAKVDGFEARVSCQFGNLGLRSDMIDLARKGRLESSIFCRTETKNEATFRFQHAASLAEMIERHIPKIDCMNGKNLVERLVVER